MKKSSSSRRSASTTKRASSTVSRSTKARASSSALSSVTRNASSFTGSSFVGAAASTGASRMTVSSSSKMGASSATAVSRRSLTTSTKTDAPSFSFGAPARVESTAFAFNVTPVADVAAPIAPAAPKYNVAQRSMARTFATTAFNVAAPLAAKFTAPQKKQLIDVFTRSFTDSADGDAPRERGTVKWFDTAKGFGFITRDSGSDLFVHFSSLPLVTPEGATRPLLRTLTEGQVVEFSVGSSAKGPCAVDCVPLVQDQ